MEKETTLGFTVPSYTLCRQLRVVSDNGHAQVEYEKFMSFVKKVFKQYGRKVEDYKEILEMIKSVTMARMSTTHEPTIVTK